MGGPTTTQHTIGLDLRRPHLVEQLFDPAMMSRLERTGRVRLFGPMHPLEDADIIVTGWDSPRLTEDVRARTRLVVHSAGSIRAIVAKSMIIDGLRVSHAPTGMARSVAELCLYYTLALLRDLHLVDRAMSSDRSWAAAYGQGLGRTIRGTRIGIVGAGQVGRSYIELVRALGADVVVHDPYLTAGDASRWRVGRLDLDDLLVWSDVVALHAPVTDETRGLIDARRLSLIRDGRALLNTARAAVLDDIALERELVSGRIRAALDVFHHEPLPPQSPLWSLPNVILTPHIGAQTLDSRREQGRIVIEEIERYVRGQPLLHEVRAEDYDTLA